MAARGATGLAGTEGFSVTGTAAAAPGRVRDGDPPEDLSSLTRKSLLAILRAMSGDTLPSLFRRFMRAARDGDGGGGVLGRRSCFG